MKKIFFLFRIIGFVVCAMMSFTACTATETPMPTNTKSPTVMVHPGEAPTATPTLPSTSTPLSTLSPGDAQALVLDLIATNGNCQLPCWWGIVPGKTTWEEANAFLSAFVPDISEYSEPNLRYWVVYDDLPDDISDGAVGASISVADGVVQTISTDTYFPISEILENYGQPTEIWVFADNQSSTPDAPFTIALFYMEQGILAIYNGTTNKSETLKICPSAIGGDQQAWLLWNPALNLTFEQVGANGLLFDTHPSERPFFQLEEVTNIDVATFYETYKDSANASTCFDISAQ